MFITYIRHSKLSWAALFLSGSKSLIFVFILSTAHAEWEHNNGNRLRSLVRSNLKLDEKREPASTDRYSTTPNNSDRPDSMDRKITLLMFIIFMSHFLPRFWDGRTQSSFSLFQSTADQKRHEKWSCHI